MRLPYLLLTAAMTVLPVYAEQAIQDMLTSDEIRAEMFGIHMQGVAGVSDRPWSECIEPDGDTVYRYDGNEMSGRAELKPEGILCFVYPKTSGHKQNCFSVSRNGPRGYVFVPNAQAGSLFRTESVTRQVSVCSKGPGHIN